MNSIFEATRLRHLARVLHEEYVNQQPFPHIVIDDFMEPEILDHAVEAFPAPDSLEFYQYDNALERKLAFDRLDLLPDPITHILQAMNAPVFLRFLEDLTGIQGLIPDPYYRGGGIHQIVTGGKLDVHIDFNKYTKFNLDRRLNVILYLNKNWREAYGGHLEIWRGHKQGEQHVLDTCERRVLPIFNRLVIFSTSEKSYHGHPEALSCPEGWTRKSLATYYYTNGRPETESVAPHSTTFIKRPDDPDDEEVAKLRVMRNKGRVASNVESDLVAS